jgi:hypothetical protein
MTQLMELAMGPPGSWKLRPQFPLDLEAWELYFPQFPLDLEAWELCYPFQMMGILPPEQQPKEELTDYRTQH